MIRRFIPHLAALLTGFVLISCGGGGGDSPVDAAADVTVYRGDAALIEHVDAAQAGLDRFNYWRSQIGLAALQMHPLLNTSAAGHSSYQATNHVISHYQNPATTPFTGECLGDIPGHSVCTAAKVSRLEAVGFPLQVPYAFGEVIARTARLDGAAAADALIAAIYHRFVVFEPAFTHIGGSIMQHKDEPVYFTANFSASQATGGFNSGGPVLFPFDGQSNVPLRFFSDQEQPDPVPLRNEVGYPVSVHASINSTISVTRFTIRPTGGGGDLPVQPLWRAVDPATVHSAAAIVPLDVLVPGTSYTVNFEGAVDEVPLVLQWRFTTTPQYAAGTQP